MADKFRVTLKKSPISHRQAARGTVRALGLHRLGETVEVVDNPATRGMARAIRFLVQVEEIEPRESDETSTAQAGRSAGADRPAADPAPGAQGGQEEQP
ncbi:MAG: 50S ribosomal protein L30 [Chloroflexi bacterium]|nr:50S ribosomal protein L30 [Chloroflexota bacterium]